MHVDTPLVILACTLSGGFNHTSTLIATKPTSRFNGINDHANNRSMSNHSRRTADHPQTSCGLSRARWGECPGMDQAVHPLHLFIPWMITLGTIVVLSMPTVLLRTKAKEKGLRLFAGNLFQFLGLLASSTAVSEHPTICYTFTIHACIRYLSIMDTSSFLVGGGWWWSLRYLSILLILGFQFSEGPAVSVVLWAPPLAQHAQQEEHELQCAYLSHLIGSVGPTLVLFCVRCVISSARYIHIHED